MLIPKKLEKWHVVRIEGHKSKWKIIKFVWQDLVKVLLSTWMVVNVGLQKVKHIKKNH